MFRNLEATSQICLQIRMAFSMMFATDNKMSGKSGKFISVFGRFGIISTFFNR